MQLKSADRKEVIEDLLDIGIFSVMGMLLKDKVSGTNEQLSNIDSQLLMMDDRIDMIHENIDRLQSQQEDDIKARQQTIKQAEDQIAEIESTINELNKVITALEEQLTDIDRLKRDQNQATKIYDKMLSKVERLKKEVDFYKNNDTCPTCLQPMDEDHKHNNIEQRNTESREVEVGADDLKKIIEDFDSKIDINLTLQKEITDQQHKIIDNQSIVNSKNMLINDLKQQLNIVQSSTKMIDDDRKKLDVLQNEREEIYRSKAELVRHKNTLGIATRLLKDTGIKSKIVKQYVPIINKLINKYLAAMDFYVQFELDEQFNETIKSRYRDQFSYASFSEGEKMRIDLALLFTWRAIAKLKNSASTNLLIMDEVFDSSLDSTGTDEFMKIVMDIVSDTNVFIISHKTDQLVDRFTNVVRFEKHKNFSRMVA
jgi:DNA repair exonuclease SbcCD ATPase subunit